MKPRVQDRLCQKQNFLYLEQNLNNQSGMSIVEVLVALGLMGILTSAMISILSTQSKEMKGMGEVLGRGELDKTLITTLADGSVCTYIFTPASISGLSPASTLFNSATTMPFQAFTMTEIPLVSSSTSPVAAKTGQTASTSSNSLVVQQIAVNITGNPLTNKFTGNITVSFNQTKLVRALPNLVYPITLQTTGSGATTQVTACQLSSGNGVTNYIAKWTSAAAIGSSTLYQDPTSSMIGFGTTTPAYALDMTAAPGGASVAAQDFMYVSDRRLKKNIESLDQSLQKIQQLRGVQFRWKKNNKKEVGLIAQEVKEVFPEVVSTNPQTGLMTVEYANLIGPIIEAIKEQQKIIEQQQAEIEHLKAAAKE